MSTRPTLDIERIQYLADTVDYPPISAELLRAIVGVIGMGDEADDEPDPAWDFSWAIAEQLLLKNSPTLAGNMMEIGRIAEQVYPLCQIALAQDGEAA